MAETSAKTNKSTRTGAEILAAESLSTDSATETQEHFAEAPPQSDAFATEAAKADVQETMPALQQADDTTAVAQTSEDLPEYQSPAGADSAVQETAAQAASQPQEAAAKSAPPAYDTTTQANASLTTDPDPQADDGTTIPGGGDDDGEGPPASIGPGNLSDLLEQLVGTNSTWQKDPVTIDGVDVIVLTVAFPELATQIPFHWQVADGMTYTDKNGEEVYSPTGAFSVFSAFGEDQIDGAMRAFARWEDLTNVSFDVVGPGDTADIYMYGVNEPDATWGATSNHQKDGDGGIISNRVRVNTEKSGWDNMELGQNGVDLLMHELGHTLGLSHPGSYDTGDNAQYDTHAEYVEDTHMYTIMSYFSGENTGANYINVNGDGIPTSPRFWTRRAATTSTRSSSSTGSTGKPATAIRPTATTRPVSGTPSISTSTAARS